MNKHIAWLKLLNACPEAIKWCENYHTLQSAWEHCERGDWMLWLLANTNYNRRQLVLIACQCARLALPHVAEGEELPLKAIETAEAWANRKRGVTLKDVRAASYAVLYAADAVSGAAACTSYMAASYAASCAAPCAAPCAASYASYAASCAAPCAASYAADAADAASGAMARNKTLAECADIVRKAAPKAPRLIRQEAWLYIGYS